MKTQKLSTRTLALLLSFVLVFSLCFASLSVTAIAVGGDLGDVDNDGDIDQFDYLLVKRSYFNTYKLSDDESERADIDGSGSVDQLDYIYIKRAYFNTYIIEDTREPITVENGLYINMPQSGTLKIAQFADVHFGTPGLPYQNDKPERTKKYMKYVVESQSPDLIVCTGDNIMSTGVEGLKDFVAFMDELKTPWTFIYGNHDAESTEAGFTKKDLSDYLETCDSPYLIYSAGYVEEANNRYGNFSISVLNNKGTRLLGAIMLLDSGGHSKTISSYESITSGQISWYNDEIDKLNLNYSGDMIPTMVFAHMQLPEFYTAYISAKNGTGAEFVIPQPMSDAEIEDIRTGAPTYENTGFYDALVKKGSTKAYFVGHAHTLKYQVKMDGIVLGFGPQTGFSTNFDDNDLPRGSYVYNFKSDFSFTTTVATEPGDDLGLTYLGTYDGSAEYDEADGTYKATLTLNSNHNLMFAYKGVRLTSSDLNVTGSFAASQAEAGDDKMFFSNEKTLMFKGTKGKVFDFTFTPETMTLNILSSDIPIDPNAPKSLSVSKVNSDAGASAIAVWTTAGTKLKEITDVSNGSQYWIGNGWRYYIVVDAEGRIAYAVLHPERGYGEPNKTGYYCNSYYSDYTKNPAIKLLDGFADDYATGGFGYKMFEIVVPEGGFAITSHGDTNNEIVKMLSQGTVNNFELSNINTRSIYDSSIRVAFDETAKTISISTVEQFPSSLTASSTNEDAGADSIALWTEAGTKIREVTNTATGEASWIGGDWRYYVVVDAEGRIAYSVVRPEKGYGDPQNPGYYCNSYYSDYTQNPAIKLLDGFADDYATGGIGYNLFEIVIPEGGFAITAHGTAINSLIDMLSQGTVSNYDISNINTRSIYDSDIRVSYDKSTGKITAKPVEPIATSFTAASLNGDAGADGIALWTQSGTKMRTVTNSENGAYTWVGNSWRYYIVVDAEGRIAYAVIHPDSGYGGPNGMGYYCNSYYSDYTQNPAISLLDGYADDWSEGGFGYKLFEIVVPEGGFAITSHGTANNRLVDILSQGTVSNYDISNINTRTIYDDSLRLSYDATTKTVSVYFTEDVE